MKKSLSANNLTFIEDELKAIHKRIALTEKSYASLIKDFTNLTVDMNRVYARKGELKHSLITMSTEEAPSLKKTLDNIVVSLQSVILSLQDHINVMQQSVVPSLSRTVSYSKSMRETLHECATAKHKQALALENIRKNKNKKSRTNKQIQLELQAQQEHLEVTRHVNQLEKQVKEFEKRKVENIKSWLHCFLHSLLSFHVKAVEGYTKAYQALRLIDIEDHMAQFQQIMFPPEQRNRVDFVRWNSFSSLN